MNFVLKIFNSRYAWIESYDYHSLIEEGWLDDSMDPSDMRNIKVDIEDYENLKGNHIAYGMVSSIRNSTDQCLLNFFTEPSLTYVEWKRVTPNEPY